MNGAEKSPDQDPAKQVPGVEERESETELTPKTYERTEKDATTILVITTMMLENSDPY